MEEELSELITQALKGSADFETVETLVRDTSLRIGAGMLETIINADRSDCRPTITHSDGTVMAYAGRREKTFVTVLGDMRLIRAYYTDAHGRGYFPRDKVLGLDTDSLSAGVKRIVGHTASISELPKNCPLKPVISREISISLENPGSSSVHHSSSRS